MKIRKYMSIKNTIINFVKKLFHIHRHQDITEIGYTYCKDCGSPFSSIGEAQYIMLRKKETRRLNELLTERKTHRRVKRVDGTEPRGLTDMEEEEFQRLQARHFQPRMKNQ